MLSRRKFLVGATLTAALLTFSPPMGFSAEGPIVDTPRGKVRGMVKDGVDVFLGVPAGKPPYEAGTRFREAQFVEPWKGVIDCFKQASLPLQGGGVIADGEEGQIGPDGKPLPGKGSRIIVQGGGDALRMNVWTPGNGKKDCPVLVYIPGGGSVSCDNGEVDGTSFAKDGIVVVSIPYRVNVDGFMKIDGVPANLAIRDMIFALKWVKENIASFGGNPDNVTVMGQSAGSTHIGSLLASPLAKGLFQKAILMSGSHLAQWSPEQADTSSKMLFDYYGIPHTREAMQALPPEKMLDFRRLMVEKLNDPEWLRYTNGNATLFKPYVDGEVLKKRVVDSVAEGAGKEVDVMIGSTANEWNYVTVPSGEIDRLTRKDVQTLLDGIGAPADLADKYKANGRGKTDGELYSAIQSDIIFRIPTNRLLEARNKGGGKTWAYSFDWKSPAFDNKMGAAHWSDIPFVFKMVDKDKMNDEVREYVGDNPPQQLADEMHAAWVRFIKNGDPGWKPYSLPERTTMSINVGDWKEKSDPWRNERELLKLK